MNSIEYPAITKPAVLLERTCGSAQMKNPPTILWYNGTGSHDTAVSRLADPMSRADRLLSSHGPLQSTTKQCEWSSKDGYLCAAKLHT